MSLSTNFVYGIQENISNSQWKGKNNGYAI